MILVTGATGSIGSELVRLLTSGGQRIRALVRDPAKAKSLGPAVELVQGDLSRPDGFPGALAGADKLFAMFPAHDIPALAPPLFDAARRAGVRHVVFLSSATIHLQPPTLVGRWHQAGEDALKATGMAFTMLRPGNFDTNSLSWAGPIRAQGKVFVPFADSQSSPIDPRDISAVAAAALTGSGHEGKTYTLSGPEVLTPRRQVEILSAVIGRPLEIVQVPEAGARAGMMKAGMTAELADAIMELMRSGMGEAHERLTTTVRDVTGRPPRTFETWARDHASAFV
jgi:uncharacterized protein YbjT (DUF2867 family)